MPDPGHAREFDFSGGVLCLDFANTIEDRPLCLKESLSDWSDLAAWAERAGLVSADEAAALGRRARANRRAADRGFRAARELRECTYRVFHATAAGEAPSAADLAQLNDAVARALRHARVVRDGHGYAWGWAHGDVTLDRVLWPVARSAADLLVSSARTDVRECASETCSWLFLDLSPRRSRRWCSMKTCGNRDKVRRFYARQRAGG
jgi:predicted RNA-binding Zn ribbon-like protein